MSGISGVVGAGEDPLPGMVEKLSHRGPHAQVTFKQERVTLGLDRLHIPGSHQPPLTAWKDWVIILDGYISNHRQLQEEMGCSGNEDQELTVLRLYEEWGANMLQKLQGAFALAISDGEEVFLARDPVGIKPLYYGIRGNSFYFASEAKALVPVTDKLQEFPPGYCYHSRWGWKKYVELLPVGKPESNGFTVETAEQRLYQLLEQEVEASLADGAPVGVLLSGGLDSSIIAALAVKVKGEPLPTFSVGAAGSPDLLQARKVAQFIGSEHHEYVYDETDLEEILPDVIYYLESYDAGLVPSSLGNFLVSRLAAEHGCNVVLSGEGADELFAGYAYMKKIPEAQGLEDELAQRLQCMHNVGCQRIDRMNAAHSIEVRVPFLEREVINFTQTLPAEWKLHGEEKVEKWILRQAFAGKDILPAEVVWRVKQPFNEGCGSTDLLANYVDRQVTEAEYRRGLESLEDGLVRNKEEYYYYQLFREHYPRALENIMGRWPLEYIC